MFTGIVTDVGRVRRIVPGGDTRFEIATAYPTAEIVIGASIACSGPCLTVIETGADWFAVQVSGETLKRTTLGAWREGTSVNLERALRLGDELGGHMVTGHVDGVGTVRSADPVGDSRELWIRPPAPLFRYIAAKGSVTVEGVSLTVNALDEEAFSLNIVPHTQAVTTLGGLRAGHHVNLEIDVVARYLERLLAQTGR